MRLTCQEGCACWVGQVYMEQQVKAHLDMTRDELSISTESSHAYFTPES